MPEERVVQYHYPPENLIPRLVDNYFSCLNPYLPLLHRPSFERALADRRHHNDIGFGSVVMLVCSLGARWTDDPRAFSDVNSPHSAGWKWFDQVQVHRKAFMGPPRLYDLQIYAVRFSYNTCHFYSNHIWAVIFSISSKLVFSPILLDDGRHWLATRSRCWRSPAESVQRTSECGI